MAQTPGAMLKERQWVPQADAGKKVKLHCAITTESAQQTEKVRLVRLIRLKSNRKSGNMDTNSNLQTMSAEPKSSRITLHAHFMS